MCKEETIDRIENYVIQKVDQVDFSYRKPLRPISCILDKKSDVMKLSTIVLAILIIFPLTDIWSTNLEISNVRIVNRDGVANHPISVIFDIKWDNSWNNEKNHDAVWVFMKFGGEWDNHVKLNPSNHRVLKTRSSNDVSPSIDVSSDSLGFFIFPSGEFRGTADYKLQILLDTANQEISWRKLNGLQVFGVEMVYIPQGAFTLGSPDEESIRRASFYKSDNDGNPAGLFTVSSEASINVSPTNGNFYYWSEEALYNGDQQGPIPAEFPKGFDAFYIMKYELTQGQYVDFLNKLPANWTYIRSPLGGRDYHKKRGGIYFKEGKYIAKHPHRPMNYVSFTDGLAYSDWAGLRPITELEYEKAARGSEEAIPAGFVWGTDSYDQLERYVNEDDDLITTNDFDESMLSDETRPILGASYFWVMDLSGSVWEKVITVGNPVGRAFKGSHGDGILDFGHATNEDWPKSDDEVGGFGYRGGGYYEVGTIYSDFNPHSPTGYRYYGAWSGGPRYISYGYRAGRTVD